VLPPTSQLGTIYTLRPTCQRKTPANHPGEVARTCPFGKPPAGSACKAPCYGTSLRRAGSGARRRTPVSLSAPRGERFRQFLPMRAGESGSLMGRFRYRQGLGIVKARAP